MRPTNILSGLGALVLAACSATAWAMTPPANTELGFRSLFVEPDGSLLMETNTHDYLRGHKDGVKWARMEAEEAKSMLNSAMAGRLRHGGVSVCYPWNSGASWFCPGLRGEYAAINDEGVLYQCGLDHVKFSADWGKTWERTEALVAPAAAPDYCHLVAVSSKVIYATGEVLHRSDDHGKHWTALTQRGSDIIPGERIVSLQIGGSGVLLASTRRIAERSDSVYASFNGGLNWKRHNFGMAPEWKQFDLIRTIGASVFFWANKGGDSPTSSLFLSLSGADPIAVEVPDTSAVMDFKIGPDGSIYMVRARAIYVSRDNGQSWREILIKGIKL